MAITKAMRKWAENLTEEDISLFQFLGGKRGYHREECKAAREVKGKGWPCMCKIIAAFPNFKIPEDEGEEEEVDEHEEVKNLVREAAEGEIPALKKLVDILKGKGKSYLLADGKRKDILTAVSIVYEFQLKDLGIVLETYTPKQEPEEKIEKPMRILYVGFSTPALINGLRQIGSTTGCSVELVTSLPLPGSKKETEILIINKKGMHFKDELRWATAIVHKKLIGVKTGDLQKLVEIVLGRMKSGR